MMTTTTGLFIAASALTLFAPEVVVTTANENAGTSPVASEIRDASPLLAVRDRYPDLSPDGRHIVFDSTRAGHQEIFIVDLEVGIPVRITYFERDSGSPVFSPDGQWIAFSLASRYGPSAIHVMRTDGSDVRQVTEPPQTDVAGTDRFLNDSHPKWAPDGASIVFNRDISASNTEIFEIDLDGTGLKRLTDREGWDTYPSISPDGRYLLWRRILDGSASAEPDRNSEIFIANRDGREPRNLTNLPAFDGYPAWFPDGERILFASNRDGDSRYDFNLYEIRLRDMSVKRLTRTQPGVTQLRPSISSDGNIIAFNRDYFRGEGDQMTLIYILERNE